MKVNNFFYMPFYLLLLTAVLFSAQHFIIEGLKDSFSFYYPVWKIYTFHFLVTLVILSVLYLIAKKMPDYVGYVFMGFILFKMTAAVIFLIPLIKMENVSKIPDFISFFAPYFLYLFFEILITLKLLKLSEA